MQGSYPPAEVQLGPMDKEKTLPAGFLVFPLKWVLGDRVGSLTPDDALFAGPPYSDCCGSESPPFFVGTESTRICSLNLCLLKPQKEPHKRISFASRRNSDQAFNWPSTVFTSVFTLTSSSPTSVGMFISQMRHPRSTEVSSFIHVLMEL